MNFPQSLAQPAPLIDFRSPRPYNPPIIAGVPVQSG